MCSMPDTQRITAAVPRCRGQTRRDSGGDYSGAEKSVGVAFCREQGSMLWPNAPVATGKNAIAKLTASGFPIRDFKLVGHPDKVGVADSGDLAIEAAHTRGVSTTHLEEDLHPTKGSVWLSGRSRRRARGKCGSTSAERTLNALCLPKYPVPAALELAIQPKIWRTQNQLVILCQRRHHWLRALLILNRTLASRNRVGENPVGGHQS
jgi:hypothetical protein